MGLRQINDNENRLGARSVRDPVWPFFLLPPQAVLFNGSSFFKRVIEVHTNKPHACYYQPHRHYATLAELLVN